MIAFRRINQAPRIDKQEAERGRFVVHLELTATYEVKSPEEAHIWRVLRAAADLLEAQEDGAFQKPH